MLVEHARPSASRPPRALRPANASPPARCTDRHRRSLEVPARTYVWGGGESRAMTAIRRHVRSERGLPRDAVSLLAYWRRTEDGAAR